MNFIKQSVLKNKFILIVVLVISAFGLLFLGNVLAIPAPIEKITFSSKELSYEENEEGSWKVDKSARWTGREKLELHLMLIQKDS